MPNFELWCRKCEKTVLLKNIKYDERPESMDCDCGGQLKPAISSDVGNNFPQGRCKGGYMRPDFNAPKYQKFY